MALIRKSEWKQMDEKQITDKITELRKELMKLRSQIRMGTTLESPGKPRVIKKTIAKGYTLLKQKSTNKVKAAPEPKQQTQQKPTGGKKKQ